MTTISVKTAIYSLISAVGNTWEVGRVEKDAAFPYATYALGNSIEGNHDDIRCIMYPLEIDVLDHDREKSTTRIEGFADSIDATLNRTHYNGSDFYMQVIRESKNPNYPTPDEFTFRRNLRYQVKVFSKE